MGREGYAAGFRRFATLSAEWIRRASGETSYERKHMQYIPLGATYFLIALGVGGALWLAFMFWLFNEKPTSLAECKRMSPERLAWEAQKPEPFRRLRGIIGRTLLASEEGRS